MAARRPARDLNVQPGKGTARRGERQPPTKVHADAAEARKRKAAAKKAATTRRENAEKAKRSDAAQRGAQTRREHRAEADGLIQAPAREVGDERDRLARTPKAPPMKDRRAMIGGR